MASTVRLLIGTAIYLLNPWIPSDVLTCVIKAMGAAMMLEGLVILGFCDIYTQFWLRSLAHLHRGWALTTTLAGLVLAVLGASHFH